VTRVRHLWPVACASLLAAGCTRARPTFTPTDPSAPIPAPPTSTAAEALAAPTVAMATVEITAPVAGASVTSPVSVEGTASLEAGRDLAAQLFSRTAEGGLAWRGNTRLAVGLTGRFSGEIAYRLPEAGPGVLELAVIDAATGKVFERRQVALDLAAAP